MTAFRLAWPLLGAIILLMPGPAWGVAPEPDDPFAARSPAASLKIVYRLTGRLEGQATLWVNGPRRVMVTQAKDNAFGLARSVHQREITTPERIVSLDLTRQKASFRPNLQVLLSLRFEALDPGQKRLVVRQIEELGQALGAHLVSGGASVSKADFLGLGARRVKIGKDEFFFWSASDIPLKEVRRLDGLYWTLEAQDILLDVEVPQELFGLPDWAKEEDWAGELARAELAAHWIMETLARPFVYLPFRKEGEEEETEGKPGLAAAPPKTQPPLRPIPWPALAPPGFRTEEARFRVSPDWKPFPLPPGQRPWPPAGLIQDVLDHRAAALAWIITNFIPK